jgi:hypothetical protein
MPYRTIGLALGSLCLLVSSVHAQGTVSISNMSYPFTNLQVGNYVEVTITGAAPGGAVTVVQNGGSPYFFGTTDSVTGNWSTSAQETGDNVGDYYQTWYVNGVALTPNNPHQTDFSYGPQLPSFGVSAGYVASSPGVYVGFTRVLIIPV